MRKQWEWKVEWEKFFKGKRSEGRSEGKGEEQKGIKEHCGSRKIDK